MQVPVRLSSVFPHITNRSRWKMGIHNHFHSPSRPISGETKLLCHIFLRNSMPLIPTFDIKIHRYRGLKASTIDIDLLPSISMFLEFRDHQGSITNIKVEIFDIHCPS